MEVSSKRYGPPENRGNAEWRKVKEKRSAEQRYKNYLARRGKMKPAVLAADGMIGKSHTAALLEGGIR